MWSPRAQNDRMVLRKNGLILERIKMLILAKMIVNIIVEKNKVVGVKTSLGLRLDQSCCFNKRNV